MLCRLQKLTWGFAGHGYQRDQLCHQRRDQTAQFWNLPLSPTAQRVPNRLISHPRFRPIKPLNAEASALGVCFHFTSAPKHLTAIGCWHRGRQFARARLAANETVGHESAKVA